MARIRIGVIVSILVIVILVIGVVSYYSYVIATHWTPAQVENYLKNKIRPGMSRKRVTNLLASKSFLHTWNIHVQGEFIGGTAEKSWIEHAGVKESETSAYMVARPAKTFVDPVFNGPINVYLFFDRNDNLLNYHVHSAIHSP